MISRIKQQGYLLIVGVIIIVIVSFLAVAVSYLAITNIRTAVNQLDATRAYYIAEAGLQWAFYRLDTDGVGCADINNTTKSFADGEFTVTTALYDTQPAPSLTHAMDLTQTYLCVGDVSSYTGPGRVVVDSEKIDYLGKSTDLTTCGGVCSPCLYNLMRASAGSIAATHDIGDLVDQEQCDITSIGEVKSGSTTLAKRQLSDSVSYNSVDLSGWAIGLATGSEESILQWSSDQWIRWTDPETCGSGSDECVDNVDLYDVHNINEAIAFAVGAANTKHSQLIGYTGATTKWEEISDSDSLPDADLYGISCTSSTNCWAVGELPKKAAYPYIVHYTGGTWTQDTSASVQALPAEDLNEIDCVDANHCWAVGNVESNKVYIAVYNSGTWTRASGADIDAIPDENLNSIACPTDSYCVAVGDAISNDVYCGGSGNSCGLAIQWNGSIWSVTNYASAPYPEPVGTDLRGVDCVSSTNCWSVGDASSQEFNVNYWDGSNWTSARQVCDPGETCPYMIDNTLFKTDMNAVFCANWGDCWSVGKNKLIMYWNGVSWVTERTDLITQSIDLQGLMYVRSKNFTRTYFTQE